MHPPLNPLCQRKLIVEERMRLFRKLEAFEKTTGNQFVDKLLSTTPLN